MPFLLLLLYLPLRLLPTLLTIFSNLQLFLYLPLSLDLAGTDCFLALSAFLALHAFITATLGLVFRNSFGIGRSGNRNYQYQRFGPGGNQSLPSSSSHSRWNWLGKTVRSLILGVGGDAITIPLALVVCLNLFGGGVEGGMMTTTTTDSAANNIHSSVRAGLKANLLSILFPSYHTTTSSAAAGASFSSPTSSYISTPTTKLFNSLLTLSHYWSKLLRSLSPLFLLTEGISSLLVIQTLSRLSSHFVVGGEGSAAGGSGTDLSSTSPGGGILGSSGMGMGTSSSSLSNPGVGGVGVGSGPLAGGEVWSLVFLVMSAGVYVGSFWLLWESVMGGIVRRPSSSYYTNCNYNYNSGVDTGDGGGGVLEGDGVEGTNGGGTGGVGAVANGAGMEAERWKDAVNTMLVGASITATAFISGIAFAVRKGNVIETSLLLLYVVYNISQGFYFYSSPHSHHPYHPFPFPFNHHGNFDSMNDGGGHAGGGNPNPHQAISSFLGLSRSGGVGGRGMMPGGGGSGGGWDGMAGGTAEGLGTGEGEKGEEEEEMRLPPVVVESFSTVVRFFQASLGQGVDFIAVAASALPLPILIAVCYRVGVCFVAGRIVLEIKRGSEGYYSGMKLRDEELGAAGVSLILAYSRVILIAVYTHLLLLDSDSLDGGHQMFWRWINVFVTLGMWSLEIWIGKEGGDEDEDLLMRGFKLRDD